MAKEFAKQFYNSAIWNKQREYILKRDGYTCTEKDCQNIATEVHHIIELNQYNIDDPNISLNENNLRSLCHDCHTKITYQMKHHTKDADVLPRIGFDANGFPIEL